VIQAARGKLEKTYSIYSDSDEALGGTGK